MATSLRSAERICRYALAAIGWSALAVANAPGAGLPTGGRAIEFSQPTNSNDVLSTNLPRSKPEADMLQEFQPRAKGNLDYMGGESSMSVPPPSLFVIPTKRLEEQMERLDRRRNWALSSPEDLLLERPLAVGSPDAEEDKRTSGPREKSPRPRQERLDLRRRGGTSSAAGSEDPDDSAASRKRQGDERTGDRDTDQRDEGKDHEKQPLETQLLDIRKSLREDTDLGTFFATPRTSVDFGDFFTEDPQKPKSLEEAAHHKAVMDTFKQVLEAPLSNPFSSGLGASPGGAAADFSAGFDSGKAASTPLFSSPFAQPDGLGSGLSGAGLPNGIADNGFNQQFSGASALSPPAQPAPTPAMAPPTPSFIFPKRVFQ